MKFNIDTLIEATNPWDFVVTLGGQDYPTRRPSVGELGAFSNAAALSPTLLTQTVATLFADPAPDPGKWSPQQLSAFLAGYLAYFNSRVDVEKKLDAVGRAASNAVTAMVQPADSPKG